MRQSVREQFAGRQLREVAWRGRSRGRDGRRRSGAGLGRPASVSRQSGCESLLRHPASNGVRLEALVQR